MGGEGGERGDGGEEEKKEEEEEEEEEGEGEDRVAGAVRARAQTNFSPAAHHQAPPVRCRLGRGGRAGMRGGLRCGRRPATTARMIDTHSCVHRGAAGCALYFRQWKQQGQQQ